MKIRVGVCGAGGRMGSTACRAITADDFLDLVAAVDPSAAAEIVGGVPVAADVNEFAAADCEVVVDFTTAAAARHNVPLLLGEGIHVVVGTTGLTDDDLAVINGRRDQLEGKIQERYGIAKDQVRSDVDTWLKSLP